MEHARQYLLSKPEAFEDYPFRLNVAVFKIRKKMFATLSERDGHWQMNLKCDPIEASVLRDVFAAVLPGYHMNKAHWNTLVLDGSMPASDIERMIDNSYALVVKGLARLERRQLTLRYTTAQLFGEKHSVANVTADAKSLVKAPAKAISKAKPTL
ncbi:MAG: putative DNA-binding protein (MmcQ/YjbR family) [Candidatus Pseudothioglobus sp.]|jgi:predicted DNA-binding protein (MmcQ/YjbR family)